MSPPLGLEDSVPTAVAIGWYLYDLYAIANGADVAFGNPDAGANGSAVPASAQALYRPLPAIGSPAERWDLLVQQLLAKVGHLQTGFRAASVPAGLAARLENVDMLANSHLVGKFGDANTVGTLQSAHADLSTVPYRGARPTR